LLLVLFRILNTYIMVSLIDVGVLRDTLLPNLAFHSTLAIPAYFVGRGLDRLVSKDVLWSSGQVSNVLYASIIRPSLVQGIPLDRVLRDISRPGWVTIAGVVLWGTRLAYRVVSRTVASGKDDPRYDVVKRDPSGWNKAFLTTFVPEAIVQSLITLAVTIPFRVGIPVIGAPREYAGFIDALAIGLWSAGFGLEVLADWQLASHKERGDQGLLREGVWSIVRHPK
jgi:steroid 5-alpha reductase family enzyme